MAGPRVRTGIHRVLGATVRWAALAVLLAFSATAALGTRSSLAAAVAWLGLLPASAVALVAAVAAVRRRDGALGIAAAAAAVAAAMAWGADALRRATPDGREVPRREVAILTHNVLFRGGSPDATVRLLRAEAADAVCLQEVTPEWALRLGAALGPTHPHRLVEARRGTHGLAIFSRFPLERPIVVSNASGRPVAACARVRLPEGDLALCTVHLASPSAIVERPGGFLGRYEANAAARRAEWRALAAAARAAYGPDTPLVVAGDLNTLEGEPAYAEMTAALVDVFRAAGRGRGATFPARVTTPPRPLARIDYVLASPSVRPVSASVLRGGGSDHLAVRATIGVPAAPPAVVTPSSSSPRRGGAARCSRGAARR